MGSIKIEWEVVSIFGPGYIFYRNEKPICKPSEVPDKYWSNVTNDTSATMDQYQTLLRWSKTGEQLIRNVKLFKSVAAPIWEEVK
jgi:hypothetical protein